MGWSILVGLLRVFIHFQRSVTLQTDQSHHAIGASWKIRNPVIVKLLSELPRDKCRIRILLECDQ